MKLNELKTIKNRPAKRVGRGLASGKGKTAGRGTKGQKSRSGYNIPKRFEGGQTPLIQRLPKTKGFSSRNQKLIVLSIAKIESKFEAGETVSFKTLIEKGLIGDTGAGVKVLGPGKPTKKLKYKDVVLKNSFLEELKKLAEVKLEKKETAAKKTTKTKKTEEKKSKA
jgi:large subunit ribosomal protein L15